MLALELLLNRRSQPRLQAPAPKGKELENILLAGCAVPDHANLKPWRFIVCENQGLEKLGKIFQTAALAKELQQEQIDRALSLPNRAPMVIVVICKYTEHEKVPREEQIASAACATQAMLMAANAQKFQGIWRTGWFAQDEKVKEALGCQAEDEIVGFLYIGSSPLVSMPRQKPERNEFVDFWN